MKMLIALYDSLFILSFLCEGKVMLVGGVIFKVTGWLFAKSTPTNMWSHQALKQNNCSTQTKGKNNSQKLLGKGSQKMEI